MPCMAQSITPMPSAQDDKYLISVAKTEYREAYNTGDVDRLLAVFAPQYVDWSEDEPSFYSTEAPRALRLRATELFKRYHVELTIMMVTIVVMGDIAFDRGWHKVRLRDKESGEEKFTTYRYLETWAKQNGTWKITLTISNKEQPPRLLPEEA